MAGPRARPRNDPTLEDMPHQSDEETFDDDNTGLGLDEPAAAPQSPEESVCLFERFRQGSQLALDELLTRYYPRVRRIVRIRMGPKLGRYFQDDDLIQDTFLEALRAIDRFELRDRSSLLSWLSRITERQLLRTVRQGRRARNDWDRNVSDVGGVDDSSDRPTGKAPARAPDPSRRVRQRELEEMIDQCLGELPEPEREVILLRHFQELPWEEIRIQLERPTVAAVQQLRARALRHLGERLLRRRDDLPSGFSWV